MCARDVGKTSWRNAHKTCAQDGKPLTWNANITRHVRKICWQDSWAKCSQDMYTRRQTVAKTCWHVRKRCWQDTLAKCSQDTRARSPFTQKIKKKTHGNLCHKTSDKTCWQDVDARHVNKIPPSLADVSCEIQVSCHRLLRYKSLGNMLGLLATF